MTNFSGLEFQIDGVGTDYAIQGSQPTHRKRLSRMMKRQATRKISELLDTLIGAAAGSTASASVKQVDHDADPGNPVVNGGVRTINTVSLINRATTAADVADLKSFLTIGGSEAQRDPTYPTDASGNGGGGKLSNPPLLG